MKKILILISALFVVLSSYAQPTRLKPGQIKEAPDSNYIWLSQEGGVWNYVPVTELDNLVGSDTRLTNPRIVNDYLIFDIWDIVTNTDIGDEAVDLSVFISSVVNNPDGTYTHDSGGGTLQLFGYNLTDFYQLTELGLERVGFILRDHDGTPVDTVRFPIPQSDLYISNDTIYHVGSDGSIQFDVLPPYPKHDGGLYISNDTIFHIDSDGNIQFDVLPPNFGDLYLSNDTLYHVDSDGNIQFVVLPVATTAPCTEICFAVGTVLLPDCGNCPTIKETVYTAYLSDETGSLEKESGTLLEVEAIADGWVQSIYDGTYCAGGCVVSTDTFTFSADQILNVTKIQQTGSVVRLLYEFDNLTSRQQFQAFLAAAMQPGSRIIEQGGYGDVFWFGEMITDVDLAGPTQLGFELDLGNLFPPALDEPCVDPVPLNDYLTSPFVSRVLAMDLDDPVSGAEFYQAFGGVVYTPGDVWTIASNGSVSFVKPDGGDYTTIIDQISPTVGLTRAVNGPIYNATAGDNTVGDNFGSIFWDDNNCVPSIYCAGWGPVPCYPSFTNWAVDNITNYSTAQYEEFIEHMECVWSYDWQGMLGTTWILYLENEDIYVEFIFDSWSSGGSGGVGGVSWTRAAGPLSAGEFKYVVDNYSNTTGEPCYGCYEIEVISTDCYGDGRLRHDTLGFCIDSLCAAVYPSQLFSPFSGGLLGDVNSSEDILTLLLSDPAKPDSVTIESVGDCGYVFGNVDINNPPDAPDVVPDPLVYIPKICYSDKSTVYGGEDGIFAPTDGSIQYHYGYSNTGLPGSWNVSGWATWTGNELYHDFGFGSVQNGDYIRMCFRLSGQPGTAVCDTKRIPTPTITATEPFNPETEPLIIEVCNDTPDLSNPLFDHSEVHAYGDIGGQLLYECINSNDFFQSGTPIQTDIDGVSLISISENCYYIYIEPNTVPCNTELFTAITYLYVENQYTDYCYTLPVTIPNYAYYPKCASPDPIIYFEECVDVYAEVVYGFCAGLNPCPSLNETINVNGNVYTFSSPKTESAIVAALDAAFGSEGITYNGVSALDIVECSGTNCEPSIVSFVINDVEGLDQISFGDEASPTLIQTYQCGVIAQDTGKCQDFGLVDYTVEITEGFTSFATIGPAPLDEVNEELAAMDALNYTNSCWYISYSGLASFYSGIYINGIIYPFTTTYAAYDVQLPGEIQAAMALAGVSGTAQNYYEQIGFADYFGVTISCADADATFAFRSTQAIDPITGETYYITYNMNAGSVIPDFPDGLLIDRISGEAYSYCSGCPEPDICLTFDISSTECDGEGEVQGNQIAKCLGDGVVNPNYCADMFSTAYDSIFQVVPGCTEYTISFLGSSSCGGVCEISKSLPADWILNGISWESVFGFTSNLDKDTSLIRADLYTYFDAVGVGVISLDFTNYVCNPPPVCSHAFDIEMCLEGVNTFVVNNYSTNPSDPVEGVTYPDDITYLGDGFAALSPVNGDNVVFTDVYPSVILDQPPGCLPPFGSAVFEIFIDDIFYSGGTWTDANDLYNYIAGALSDAGVTHDGVNVTLGSVLPGVGDGACDFQFYNIEIVCPSTTDIERSNAFEGPDPAKSIVSGVCSYECIYTFPASMNLTGYGGAADVVVNSEQDIINAFADLGIVVILDCGEICFPGYAGFIIDIPVTVLN